MADEIQVRASLQVTKALQLYTSRPEAVNLTMDDPAGFGPSPGALVVGTGGTVVDVSELTDPGVCFMYNAGPTAGDGTEARVEYGVWDPDAARFYPALMLPAGMMTVFFFPAHPGEVHNDPPYGTGTGTTGGVTRLFLRALDQEALVRVEGFNR